MHNLSVRPAIPFPGLQQPQTETPAVRAASPMDAGQVADLVAEFVAAGLMLPRTREQVLANIDNYVVAARRNGPVVACAALDAYSPSLAEVSSVAVSRTEHGNGLGSLVVLGVERLARARGIDELFALSLTDRFFLSLGYEATSIARYPEKLARYQKLRERGLEIIPKRCFRKLLGEAAMMPVESPVEHPQLVLLAG